MRQWITAATALCCVAMTFTPSKSRASACDTFFGDSGDNTILVGMNASSFWYQGQLWYYSLGKMAICWEDQSALWHYVENPTGCNVNSTSSEYVYISAGAGNDSVAANSVGHTCVAGYTPYLLPFDGYGFSFSMWVVLGTGSDHDYGSGNDDTFESNYRTFLGQHPADNANDFVCGYDGDDLLYGDGDQSDSGYWPIDPMAEGHEERLNGGLGTDYCHGGDNESVFDWAMVPDPNADPRVDPVGAGGCNTWVSSSSTTPAHGWMDYAHQMKLDICGTTPPNLWW